MTGIEWAAIGKAIGIRGGAIIALVLLCTFLMIRAHSISGEREDLRDKLADAKASHAITRSSVRTLEQQLANFIGAGKAAKVRQLSAIEAQARDSKLLQDQADAIRQEMAEITSSPAACKCATPRAILDAKGL